MNYDTAYAEVLQFQRCSSPRCVDYYLCRGLSLGEAEAEVKKYQLSVHNKGPASLQYYIFEISGKGV